MTQPPLSQPTLTPVPTPMPMPTPVPNSVQHPPALRRLINQVQTAVDQREPLDIRGGGTKSFYGGAARGTPLDVRSLAGISSLEPTELVVTARAGTPLAELEAALAEVGQCLPFEPPRFAAGPAVGAPAGAASGAAPSGTVGGMVAAGLSGPARASVGALRDYVLGVTLLDGRGEVLTFGGQVMKNVAGYDVPRLMAGSMGVLGVLCEVSLKVLPVAVERATLVFDMGAADALHQCALWAGRPLPVNATAWHDGRLHVRLAGARAAVRSARERLGGAPVEGDAAAEWWDAVRDQRHAFFSDRGRADSASTLWRLSVPPTRPPLDLPGDWFIEWGGALRWLWSDAASAAVHAAAAGAGGHATRYRSAVPSGEPHAPLSEPLLGIHRRLKSSFDPHGVFNPGRLHPAF